ncbi:MAG TPA: filamentous hemagglutinin N-terminal domain-containing protein, partial [Ramlibacter sp.]|nr:filamentous hemagglutinin N-terminal domain-containing protein [Ramlibacter sp.]
NRTLAQALAVAALGALPTMAVALPQGLVDPARKATAAYSNGGRVLTVNTRSQNSSLRWNSFSIGDGEGVHFQQLNANSLSVNRVTQQGVSHILGSLTSNGQVVLINPWGIAFGRGASVDTAGFTATTMDVEAPSALFRRRGAITVDGTIKTDKGDIVLLAPDIRIGADAKLEARQGTVVLAGAGDRWASATKLKLQFGDRELDNVLFELQPDKLARALEGVTRSGADLFTGTLQHSGAIVATGINKNQAGQVVLLASPARIDTPGRISADNGLRINGGAAAPTPAPGPGQGPGQDPGQGPGQAPGQGPGQAPGPVAGPGGGPARGPAGPNVVDRMQQAAGAAATRANLEAAVAELDGEAVRGGLPPARQQDDKVRGRRDRGAPDDAEICLP